MPRNIFTYDDAGLIINNTISLYVPPLFLRAILILSIRQLLQTQQDNKRRKRRLRVVVNDDVRRCGGDALEMVSSLAFFQGLTKFI